MVIRRENRRNTVMHESSNDEMHLGKLEQGVETVDIAIVYFCHVVKAPGEKYGFCLSLGSVIT